MFNNPSPCALLVGGGGIAVVVAVVFAVVVASATIFLEVTVSGEKPLEPLSVFSRARFLFWFLRVSPPKSALF